MPSREPPYASVYSTTFENQPRCVLSRLILQCLCLFPNLAQTRLELNKGHAGTKCHIPHTEAIPTTCPVRAQGLPIPLVVLDVPSPLNPILWLTQVSHPILLSTTTADPPCHARRQLQLKRLLPLRGRLHGLFGPGFATPTRSLVRPRQKRRRLKHLTLESEEIVHGWAGLREGAG